MRRTCLDHVYKLARQDERVVFIGSDLGAGVLDNFKKEMPERFFMEAVAEANVVGMACGMAREGKVVYVNTIQSFLTRRCYEQIVLDACLHNLNVRFIGNGGGTVYAPLGPTHWATEDLSILRVIPNMTILAPADAEEMARLMPATLNHQGPVFIRLGKGFDPVVTRDEAFEIGKASCYRDGTDALIISCGIALGPVQKAAELLGSQGVEASVLHVPTVKPLDVDVILQYAQMATCVVTVEENTILGGLGGAVAEVLAEACLEKPLLFKRMGFEDSFSKHYGSQNEHLARVNITGEGIASTVLDLLER